MSFLECLKQLYSDSDCYIAAVDNEFRMLWKNHEQIPDNLLLSDFTIGDKKPELPIEKEIICFHCSESSSRITPLYEEGVVKLYKIEFFKPDEIHRLFCRSQLLNYKNNFLGNIRLELAEILNIMEKAKENFPDDCNISAIDSQTRYHVLRTIASTVNMNEISKYYSGGMSTEYLSLSQRLEETAEWVRPMLEINSCAFRVTIAEQIYIDINYSRFEAAVLNLIINAYMYNDSANKEITLELTADGDRVCVSVSDNGTSADVGEIEKHLDFNNGFKKFSPHESLGLAVVKAMTDAFDGTVELENSPTGGLKVKLFLPRYPKSVPKVFRLRRLPTIISQYDPQYCIISKGIDPIK